MFQLRVSDHDRDCSLYLLRLPKAHTKHSEVTLKKKVRPTFGGSVTLLAPLLALEAILGVWAVELSWFDFNCSTNNLTSSFHVQENQEGPAPLLLIKTLYLF